MATRPIIGFLRGLSYDMQSAALLYRGDDGNLLWEAEAALARQSAKTETPEEWANRVAPLFCSDLDKIDEGDGG